MISTSQVKLASRQSGNFRMAILAVLCLFNSSGAWALCSASNGVINFPSPIISQRDDAIGSTIATASVVTDILCDSIEQSGGWRIYFSPTNVDYGASSIANVRLTTIPGVGIRWTNHNSAAGSDQFMSALAFDTQDNLRGIYSTSVTTLTDTFELIKIGDITPGTLVWTLGYNYRTTDNTDKGKLIQFSLPEQHIKQVACSVGNSLINVPMGDLSRRVFSGIGSTPEDNAFAIPLNCDAQTRVQLTLDAVADSSKAPGVIALNSTGAETVARGVGIQLLHNNTPVNLGTPITIGTVTTKGDYNIPLVARYYQTEGAITAGQANSTATFTMTYN